MSAQMITCEGCGTANPQSTTVCLACGEPIAGQRLAEALALARLPSSPGLKALPTRPYPSDARYPAGLESSDLVKPLAEAPDAAVPAEPDAAATYLKERESSLRRKRIKRVFLVLSLVALAGAYAYRRWDLSDRRAEAAGYLSHFGDIDSGTVGKFFRCALRKPNLDISSVSDNLVVTRNLHAAFLKYPDDQPDYLDGKCLPHLESAQAAIKGLQPPKNAALAQQDFLDSLKRLNAAFAKYNLALEAAQEDASREKAILDAAAAFHDSGTPKRRQAARYTRFLHCAIPGLARKFKAIRGGPDAGPVVEHVYASCKGDPRYAQSLRGRCYNAFTKAPPKGGKLFSTLVRRLRGDARDISALTYCFERANADRFRAELAAIGHAWVDYRNSATKVRVHVARFVGVSP